MQKNGWADQLVAVECNYKEIHRLLEEQFIHGLNDNDMLAEIIRAITKAKECTAVTSERVLIWAKSGSLKSPVHNNNQCKQIKGCLTR